MTHATVKIDGMDIPLLGLPADATEDQCDHCFKPFHLSELRILRDGFFCESCIEELGQKKIA